MSTDEKLCQHCTPEEGYYSVSCLDGCSYEFVASKNSIRLLGFGAIRKALEDKLYKETQHYFPIYHNERWYIGRKT